MIELKEHCPHCGGLLQILLGVPLLLLLALMTGMNLAAAGLT